jgi:FkbM family methyltransferase
MFQEGAVSLVQQLRLNVSDVLNFGPTVLMRHLTGLTSGGVTTVRVPRVGAVLVRTADSDMAAVRQAFTARDYELTGPAWPNCAVQAKYESIVAGGGKPIIVDAGANIGVASLSFASQFPHARIVAIEPDPGNSTILRRNLEGRANCTIVEAAIGADRGFVRLHNEGQSWAVRTERAQSGVSVITVDDAFAASGGDTPFIVKVDIEGFEKELFAANISWIERTQVVIIEPHDWMLPGQSSSRSFQEAMTRCPFELHIRGENLLYVRV